MSTYTIPDVVLPSEVGAVVHLAVPGERSGHCGPRRDCCEVPHDPPPVLADLVGKQCETCHGEGETETGDSESTVMWGDGQNGSAWNDCPACAGSGSALVDLVRECQNGVVTAVDIDHSWCGRDGHSARCTDGVVSLGRWKVKALVEWRPPGDNPDEASYCGPATVQSLEDGTGARYWPAWDGSQDWDDGQDITIHGTPEPGGYVATLELVVA